MCSGATIESGRREAACVSAKLPLPVRKRLGGSFSWGGSWAWRRGWCWWRGELCESAVCRACSSRSVCCAAISA